jgi:uncharacterized protein (DUF697 family)
VSVKPLVLVSLVRELRTGAGDTRPLVVAGVPALVPALARELRRGGEAGAVVENGPSAGAAVLVEILEDAPGAEQLARMRAAADADVSVVAVTETKDLSIPYVLATDIVRVAPGAGFPIDEIASAVARRLGESGTALAARLPVLRGAVCDELIRSFSRRNGLIGAAVFVPGVDMPLLTLNQVRLVLRIAAAHGQHVDASRAPELLATFGGAIGFRALARELLDVVPVAGWALKGAVAYTGTRAIGEAAFRYFAAGAPLAQLAGGR